MSLLDTQMLAVQAHGGLDRWETRLGSYGSWAKIWRDSNLEDGRGIITNEMKALSDQSQGRVFNANVLDFNDNVTITATRPLDLSPVLENSVRKTVTFSTIQGTISVIPAMHKSNEISMQKAWANSYRSMIKKMLIQLNTLGEAYLDTNKADAVNEAMGHTFNATSDELEVDYTDREAILGDISIVQNANDYFDTLDIVGNSRNQQLLNKLMEKGLYNTDDKTYQYNDKNFFFDHNMGSDAGMNAQFYAAPVGSTGALIRQEADALLNHETGDGRRWRVIYDELLGMPISEYAYSEAIDASALHGAASAHLGRTLVHLYSYSFEVAFVPTHTSTAAGPAPIIKVSVKDAV